MAVAGPSMPVNSIHSVKSLPNMRFTAGEHKRPRAVHMDNSDDDLPTSFTNGNAHPSKRRKASGKSGKPDPALLEQRKQLPIWKGRQSLVNAVAANDTVVILGETGSGKTTQVPQFLFESNQFGQGMIAITQPRKVAAISLATRVSEEQGTSLGERVGYSVRFDERSNDSTKIKYLTDGMLVRELLSDSLLSRYSVIIVDEAHERTLRTDMLLAALKTIQKERNSSSSGDYARGKGKGVEKNPLKVIIMSATLDAERFSKFFNGAPILFVEGRQHPVKIVYTEEPQHDYIDSALKTFFQIHTSPTYPHGDVLIFLSGQEEIETLERSIKLYADQLKEEHLKVLVCPLYAALPQHLQNRIFHSAPPNTRKVILATNIAETSITIPGIRFVIDTGNCKEKTFVPQHMRGNGIDLLLLKPISQSSAQQRAGRAGREGPGWCFRLYTEDTFKNEMRPSAIPEIQRCNLTFAVLQIKCVGQDPLEMEFMDAPSPDAIKSSYQILLGLGALSPSTGAVTPLGTQMSNFPLSPPHARSLIASSLPEHSCTAQIILILSILSATSKLLIEPRTEDRDNVSEVRAVFRDASGDHMTLLNVLRAYEEVKGGNEKEGMGGKGATKEWCTRHFVNERAVKETMEIAKQLKMMCRRAGIDPNVTGTGTGASESERVLKSLMVGQWQNTAMIQKDGTYVETSSRKRVKIHPSSALFSKKVPAIVYDELIMTSDTYARTVSTIQQSWILDLNAFKTRFAVSSS